ncbi:hypothetical protein RND71_012244 [Anisodus tanguticus]|uniref:Uncharacterized protein n=1 Tax=Anisodus tanguticus TaxID=243964 RepID=A0AAE1VGS2_9SOLA|nr:hypothetical protein RND71_012244 [Anisodus tanguticus]
MPTWQLVRSLVNQHYIETSGIAGIYAETDFKEEDLVLKDQMLAGTQHSSNMVDCLVCSYCFCFIGSIELQIGRKLYLEQLGVSPNNECHMQKDCYNSDSSLGEDDSDVEDQQVSKECSSSPSKDKIPLPKDVVESLFNGEMKLPYSEKFSLPPVVTCPGGYTNDIFLLEAKVIFFTVLRHRKLKESPHEGKGKQVISESIDFSLLGEAWKPVSMGYKRRWWDCIALPDDVDGSDEASFRMQIKELAFMKFDLSVCIVQSLQLLKAAIFDEECKPLFSLEIYGNIIGMFELNNLSEEHLIQSDSVATCQYNEIPSTVTFISCSHKKTRPSQTDFTPSLTNPSQLPDPMEMDSDRLAGSGFEDYVRVDDGGNVRSISQGSDESVVEEERGVDEVSSVNERKVFPVELSRNVMKLTCESSAK